MAKAKKSVNQSKQSKKLKVNQSKVKTAAAVKTPKLGVPKAPYKKSEFFKVLSEQTGFSTKAVKSIFDSFKAVIQVHLAKGGPNQFVLPGLIKITVINKPATKARKGINPFTGEETLFKAKPARKVVKVRALKSLKEMV